jgi:hypothetical protein
VKNAERKSRKKKRKPESKGQKKNTAKRDKKRKRGSVKKNTVKEGVSFLHSGVIVRKEERKKTRWRGRFAAKP